MEVQELRIGNIVEGNIITTFDENGGSVTRGPIVIKSISSEGINLHYFRGAYVEEIRPHHSINTLSGITLSEYWLTKLNIPKCPRYLNFFELELLDNSSLQIFLGEQIRVCLEVDYDCLITDNGSRNEIKFPHIKYVHQLQNLYFALTNTELELSNKLTETPTVPPEPEQ